MSALPLIPPPSRADVMAAAARHLPDGQLADFERMLRPTIGFVRSDAAGVSRFGGHAVLPGGRSWPTWNGRPLQFLALIDLAGLAGLPSDLALPSMGTLSVFFDHEEQPWGFRPEDQGGCQVFYDPSGATMTIEHPAGVDAFTAVSVAPRAGMSVPHPWEEGVDALGEEASDLVFAVLEDLDGDGDRVDHRLGGWPSIIQSPIWLECQLTANGVDTGGPAGYQGDRVEALRAGAADWQLLLQVDSDEASGWMFGDIGRLYVCIRRQDLAELRFDRCWTVLQCY